jgi:hypothetical protein
VERVLGIGGFFFRATDPGGLAAWYEQHLGINPVPSEPGDDLWEQEAGPTVFSPFPADTEYFGRRDQHCMVNFRVADLDAMLNQLRRAGVAVDDEVQEMEGVGRFGWAYDPEGTRFELWQPTD